MNTLQINFAPRSLLAILITTPRATRLMGCIGLALFLSAALVALNCMRQQSAQTADLQRIEAQLATRARNKSGNERLPVSELHAAAVNAAIAQLNLPWRDFFEAMESATFANIALLSLEPDAKQRLVKGSAEAINSDDMFAYLEQLQRQGFFSAVTLTRHEINEHDSRKPIRFQFEAQWPERAQ